MREGLDGCDLYEALTAFVEQAAAEKLRSVLAPDVLATWEQRPLRFVARCRVSGIGAERQALGEGADWTELKTAVRNGIQRATNWELELRSASVEVTILAFFGKDHLALGVESPEPVVGPGAARFSWSQVPRAGMHKALAGAMASLAMENAERWESGVVVDPTCGMGTLLLAAARLWSSADDAKRGARPLRLVGRDQQESQLERCRTNFVACGLDDSDVRLGNGRTEEAFDDVAAGSVDAFICDLPCGAQYKASSDTTSYADFLGLAAKLLRPGGRCVLLSTRRRLLAKAVSPGPWRLVVACRVGRGEGNLRESQLLSLERTRDGEGQGAEVERALFGHLLREEDEREEAEEEGNPRERKGRGRGSSRRRGRRRPGAAQRELSKRSGGDGSGGQAKKRVVLRFLPTGGKS